MQCRRHKRCHFCGICAVQVQDAGGWPLVFLININITYFQLIPGIPAWSKRADHEADAQEELHHANQR